MPKIQEKNGQFSLTIPKEYMILLQWKKGDTILFSKGKEKEILLSKVNDAENKI